MQSSLFLGHLVRNHLYCDQSFRVVGPYMRLFRVYLYNAAPRDGLLCLIGVVFRTVGRYRLSI
jgi:hypothetical protein